MAKYLKQLQLLRAWTQGVLRSDFLGYARSTCVLAHQAKSLFSTIHVRNPQNVTNLVRRWSSSSSSDGVRWLWEVDQDMVVYSEGPKHGTRTACIEFTFNTVKPLEPRHFHQAFTHYIRKWPSMRTVMRPRGDSHWYCQVNDPVIDFEVMTDQDNFREDCNNVIAQGFHYTDSLPWKARVIERGPDAPCHVEGVKEKYPYQYDLMMLYNHALSDGTELTLMINSIHKLLDQVAGGETVNDDQVGIYEKNEELKALLNQKREKFLQDKNSFDLIKNSLPALGDVPLIIQAFPRPKVSKATTKHVLRKINPQLLKSMFLKCSEKKVTFNSFCVATCNVAFAELIKEAGLKKDSYDIACIIYVNARRYATAKKHLHGFHILPLTYMSAVQQNDKDNFWEYCTKVNHDLQLYYTEKDRHLEQATVQQMLEADYPSFNFSDNPLPSLHDFSIGNLGNLTKIANGEGENVQLTSVLTMNKVHHTKNSLMQEIYTFRGRGQYTLTYVTDYFTEETTNLIADRIFHLFETFSKS